MSVVAINLLICSDLRNVSEPNSQIGGKGGIAVYAGEFGDVHQIEADVAPAVAQQRNSSDDGTGGTDRSAIDQPNDHSEIQLSDNAVIVANCAVTGGVAEGVVVDSALQVVAAAVVGEEGIVSTQAIVEFVEAPAFVIAAVQVVGKSENVYAHLASLGARRGNQQSNRQEQNEQRCVWAFR